MLGPCARDYSPGGTFAAEAMILDGLSATLTLDYFRLARDSGAVVYLAAYRPNDRLSKRVPFGGGT